MNEVSKIIFQLFELFMQNPIWQTLGILAFLVSIINFAFMKDKKFIIWTLIASIFWWIHFHSIWALAAAYINYFDVIKNALALKYERNKKWMYAFFAIYSLIWIFTFLNINLKTFSIWDYNYFSLFPTFCSLFSTYLVFNTRWIKMKSWFLLVVASWLVYNITYWSIWWVMTDLSLFLAWAFWIYKDLKEKNKTVN